MMNGNVKLVAVLVIICTIAGTLLAWVHKVTYEPIKATERRLRTEAMKEVLPEYDNDPLSETVSVTDGGEWKFNIARKGGQYAGAAFEATSSKGYSGDIVIMVGVNADGSVQAVKVIKQKETPGLGAKVLDPAWRAQFSGKSISGTKWSVKKDQGEIDQITAATISSRAVTEALKNGLEVYTRNRETIAKTQGGQP
jgi:electron transport complex protein RnfG